MMKKIFFLALSLTILFSCRNNDANKKTDGADSLSSRMFYWQAYLDDSTGKLDFRKIPANDTLTIPRIIDFLNQSNANIKLEYVKTSNDTIFIRIPNALYLTQQMGSTGPTLFLSEVVYNMLQMPDIKEVNIDFDEGDHATPGTYNKTTFDNN